MVFKSLSPSRTFILNVTKLSKYDLTTIADFNAALTADPNGNPLAGPISFRHLKSLTTIAFADGHVEAVPVDHQYFGAKNLLFESQ